MEDLRACSAAVASAAATAAKGSSIERRKDSTTVLSNGEGIVCQIPRGTDYDQEEQSVLAKSGGGHAHRTAQEDQVSDREIEALFVSRAWNLSISPAKNIGPSIFMIYMMGGGIFGLMFLGFAMLNTVKTLMAVNKVFDDFERAAKVKGNTLLQRIAYVAICLAFSGFFTYRAISSGALPLGSSTSQLINPRHSSDATSIFLDTPN